ncbi:MAG: hypothetical protein L6Q66_07560 [Bacteroidia bacterium]|nr:hypothetical protein [Bacteroidia bacterium]
MKQEHSQLLYEQYKLHPHVKVELVLKNGRSLKGFIMGWFKEDADEPCISKWHIVEAENRSCLGIDAFGYLAGEVISQSDIISFRFEDQ